MSAPAWLEDLSMLVARHGGVIGQDLATMTLAQLWGLHLYLHTRTSGQHGRAPGEGQP
jgi:hypothetical protein